MANVPLKKKITVSRVKRGTFVLPKFAAKVHEIISSKYQNTYVVGGAVRNFLLKKKVSDVDIASSATPDQVEKLLRKFNIAFSVVHKNFGVIVSEEHSQKIEITTFRSELYGKDRFPRVRFVKDVKEDSNRRDFTINALYFNPKSSEIFDFHQGLKDLKKRALKFIGDPEQRIKEDPLRVLRAYRFALQYKFKFDKETATGIKKQFHLLSKVSKTRMQKEIQRTKPKSLQKTLQKVIHSIS